jgi:hypothetical protein
MVHRKKYSAILRCFDVHQTVNGPVAVRVTVAGFKRDW